MKKIQKELKGRHLKRHDFGQKLFFQVIELIYA